MAWTWDRYRDTATVWHRAERTDRQRAEPLSRFVKTVDRMFYAAAVAFVITIVAVLLID